MLHHSAYNDGTGAGVIKASLTLRRGNNLETRLVCMRTMDLGRDYASFLSNRPHQTTLEVILTTAKRAVSGKVVKVLSCDYFLKLRQLRSYFTVDAYAEHCIFYSHEDRKILRHIEWDALNMLKGK